VAQERREKCAMQHSKKYSCTVSVPPRTQPFPARTKTLKKISPSVIDTLCEDEADELELLRNRQDDLDASNFTPAQKQEQLSLLHKCVDDALASVADLLEHLLLASNTDGYMAQFSLAVEAGVAKFGNLDSKQCKELAGRSCINLKKVVETPVALYNCSTDTVDERLSREAHRHLMQHRRLLSIKNCSYKLSKASNANRNEGLRVQLLRDVAAFRRDVSDGDGMGDLLNHVVEHDNDLIFNIFKITRASEMYIANFRSIRSRQSRKGRSEAKARLHVRKAHGLISRSLKASTPAPMTCLKRGQDMGVGKPKGSFTSDPEEIDQILRKAWAAITDGNVCDTRGSAHMFWENYGCYCHQAPEWVIGDLTLEEFKATCSADKESAAGLDGWAARDIALLSDYSLGFVVKLLNAIERGAPWPEHMLHTRAVFLSKDPEQTDNPLSYRILKITSGWYRKWGTCRNRGLRDWIKTWDCPELNSGVPGKGAQDAWLNIALRLELAQLNNQQIAGASVDVYKCFDQINRDLVLLLAEKAGMPRRILIPYFNYIDSLKIRYQIGSTVGGEHYDKTSIPQGCPFSMTIVALILLPWIQRMRALNVEPRVLADDLMAIATGKNHIDRTVAALQESKTFFTAIGAKVADNKCFTFAGDSASRKELGEHTWDSDGLLIPCRSSFRDLGSHLNLGRNHNGVTLTQRINKAVGMANRLNWMQAGDDMKERVVLCNLLPAALYGVESIRVATSALKSLRSAIANVVGPRSQKRCVNLVFDCVSANKELDPIAYILVQRVTNLRRVIAKHHGKKGMIGLIIKRYHNYVAKSKYVAPSMWDALERDAEEVSPCVFGPLGLLMQDLDSLGYAISQDFIISKVGEAPIHVLDMPWQHLKSALCSIVARSRAAATSHNRSFCGKFDELDNSVLKSVVNSLGHKEKHVYRHVATGAYWDDDDLADIQLGDGLCKHCGATVSGPSHILWDCPVINSHRTDNTLEGVRSEHLPKAVAVGLPPALGVNLQKPLWEGSCEAGTHEAEAPTCITKCGTLDKADAKDALLQDMLILANKTDQHNCARACFGLLKGDAGSPCVVLPNVCHAHAPESINVYSDGSWLNPLKQFLGLGGAGVWWPARLIAEGTQSSEVPHNPLSEAELQLAHYRQLGSGLQLFTKIGGYAGSSTRTELAAGIIALCADGPVHIGSDSRAFVDKANNLLDTIRRGVDPQDLKSWSVVNDGDLWAYFCAAVMRKGYTSVRITWVKGHAKQHHIEQGITTLQHKAGNDAADHAADEATALHGADVVKVAGWLHDRAKAYLGLMKKVSHHIVESYLIHRTLVERSDEDAACVALDQDRGTSYVPLAYPSASTCRPLKNWASIANYHKFKRDTPGACEVQDFLANLVVAPVAECVRPITWIELYILFVMRGYRVPYIPETIAQARPTPDKLIKEFKCVCRGVVCRTLPSQGDARLFQPAQKTRDDLKGVGVLGQNPSVSFNVFVSDDERKYIAIAIVHLSRQAMSTNVEKYISGTRKLVPRILTLNGNSGWVSTVKTLSSPLTAGVLWAPAPVVGVSSGRNVTFYKCKQCDLVEPSTCTSFQYTDLDRKHKCMHCKKSSSVKDWSCECGENWFNCALHACLVVHGSQPLHSHVQATEQPASSKSLTRAPNVTASEPSQQHKEYLRTGVKRFRDRSAAVVTFSDYAVTPQKRIKYGPVLSKRFSSIVSSSSISSRRA
jgi:ribonuclease HI